MLNIDPVVKVNVQVGTGTATAGVFNVGAIIGYTPVSGKFDSTHRFKEYENVAEMVDDGFSITSAEYKAALKYFGVDPAPASVVMVFCNDAPAYSSSATYAVGDVCVHEEKVYSCNTAISTAEDWTSGHWTEVGDVETPTVALLDAIDKGAELYAVYYIPVTGDADVKTKLVGLVSALNSLSRGVLFYGVTGTVESAVAANGLFDTFAASGSRRACGMYCTSEIDDACGLMGAAMGLSRNNETSAFALCYKSVASATKNEITQSEVTTLKAKNANVLVQRTRSRAYIENGACASGMRFDEVLYVDRMAYDIQQAIYEMIANSATKLPQNDSTSLMFISEISSILESYYSYGVLAEAQWRGATVGGVEAGTLIAHGHNEFCDSFDNQSQVDRELHKAMPITVLICLSGSVESIVITVDVQT